MLTKSIYNVTRTYQCYKQQCVLCIKINKYQLHNQLTLYLLSNAARLAF